MNLAVANTNRSRHLTQSVPSENQGPGKPSLLTTEDYENEAPHQSAFDAFGREADGASSFVTGRARVMQRLAKMPKSMPVEALSDLEKISDSQDPGGACNIFPRIPRLERLVGRQQCGVFGCGQTSHGVHELAFFRGSPGLERREIVGRRPSSFLLSRSWRRIGEMTAPGGSLERSGRGDVQDGWCAGGMSEASLPPGKMLSLRPSSFLAPTEGGVRIWVILLFPQTSTARSKTGEADDTISLDSKRCLWKGPVFERLQRRQPQDKLLLNLNYAEYMLLFRRAAANLQVDVVPCQGRHSGASVDRAAKLRTLVSIQKRGRWTSAKSVRHYEKSGRVNKSWSELAPLVQAQQPPALGFASWPCLTDTASTASSFVIDLFTASTDLQRLLLDKVLHSAKLNSILSEMTTQFFRREFNRFCASWHVVRFSP